MVKVVSDYCQLHFIVLARQQERRSLHNFSMLLSLTCEVLSLWEILSAHQFHVVTAQLSPLIRDQLCSVHLSAIVVGGQHVTEFTFIFFSRI